MFPGMNAGGMQALPAIMPAAGSMPGMGMGGMGGMQMGGMQMNPSAFATAPTGMVMGGMGMGNLGGFGTMGGMSSG